MLPPAIRVGPCREFGPATACLWAAAAASAPSSIVPPIYTPSTAPTPATCTFTTSRFNTHQQAIPPSLHPSTQPTAITSSSSFAQPVIVLSSSPGRISLLFSQKLASPCPASPAPPRLTSRSSLAHCRLLTQPALPLYSGASICHDSLIPPVGSRRTADDPAGDLATGYCCNVPSVVSYCPSVLLPLTRLAGLPSYSAIYNAALRGPAIVKPTTTTNSTWAHCISTRVAATAVHLTSRPSAATPHAPCVLDSLPADDILAKPR